MVTRGRIFTRRRTLAASAAAMLFAATRPVRAQGALAVRVGDAVGDTFMQAYYANDLGTFKRWGLDADVESLAGGGAIGVALAGGAIDFGVTSVVTLAQAIARGLPFRLVAAGATNTAKAPTGAICVLPNSPIGSAADLAGKTIAINSLKTLSDVAVDAWLAKSGISADKLRKVEMIYSEMTPALERGTVAAAVPTEPFTTAMLRAKRLRRLADPMTAISTAPFLISVWISTTNYVRANREAVRRFSGAIGEVGRWANRHHDESGVILAKYAKLEPEAIAAMVRCDFADTITKAMIAPTLDAAVRFGQVAKPIAFEDLVAEA